MGHFGYKVLALSYDGTLKLRGLKGTSIVSSYRSDDDPPPKAPDADRRRRADRRQLRQELGLGWRLYPDDKQMLTLDPPVGNRWNKDDEIVVMITILPGAL